MAPLSSVPRSRYMRLSRHGPPWRRVSLDLGLRGEGSLSTRASVEKGLSRHGSPSMGVSVDTGRNRRRCLSMSREPSPPTFRPLGQRRRNSLLARRGRNSLLAQRGRNSLLASTAEGNSEKERRDRLAQKDRLHEREKSPLQSRRIYGFFTEHFFLHPSLHRRLLESVRDLTFSGTNRKKR